jgi:hypothetical protein
VGRYGIERGDVLLSIQMILTREAERPRPRLVAAPVAPPVVSVPGDGRNTRRERRDQMLERSWPASA